MVGKAIPVRSGVYVLEADEGLYIGQTRNFYQRWQGHVSAFDRCGIAVLNKLR